MWMLSDVLAREQFLWLFVHMNSIFPSSSFLSPNNFRASGPHFGCLVALPVINDNLPAVPGKIACSRCGCLKETQESVCALCQPRRFYEVSAQGDIPNLFIIGGARAAEQRVIQLAIDLSIPYETISQMIDTFSSDAFVQTFEGFCFSAAFLAECPVHVTRKGESLNLCFGDFFIENEIRFRACAIGPLLRDAFKMVQLLVNRKTSSSAFSSLFDQVARVRADHMFLFCATKLDAMPREIQFGVTFIEFGVSADRMPNSILLPFCQEWNHCMIVKWADDVIKYLHKRVDNVIAKSVRLKVVVSSGFEIVWTAEGRRESGDRLTQVMALLKNFTPDGSLIIVVQASQKYAQESHFCIHIEYEFDNGQLVVANRTWRKATSMEEWDDSFNIINLCAIAMKQHAVHALLSACQGKQPSFSKKAIWNIANLRAGDPVEFAKQVFAVFKALILDETSPMPVSVRRELLFQIAREGPSYIGHLSGRLIELRDGGEQVKLPPFVITDHPVEITQDPPYDAFIVNLVLPQDHFRKLQQYIKTVFAKSSARSTRK